MLIVTGLVGVVVVVVAVLAGAAVLRSKNAGSPDQAVPGPVLLVPGYGGSAGSLAPLAAALRSAGKDVTVVQLPGQALGDLSEQADALGQSAAAVLQRTGSASVDVVGYSAGGVVARLWVTEGRGAAVVRRLVTLGSPHHGTEVAGVGTLVEGACPVACQQLAPDSAVLSRLDTEPVPAGVVALSLWTTLDDVVRPPSSAAIDGVPSPSLQSICSSDRARHGDLPGDRTAQAVIREALAGTALPTWGPGDCARLSGSG